ncbi:unnamed protein product [Rotaria sp. Silwood1]|nr:unnamed protein product [Rotaria sp. Silwood1]CAF4643649.1 unnamed protein product [Rotaria sp. Silwood1]
MHTLSTSVVSLHSYAGSHNSEKKSTKTSDRKPSIIYFLALFYAFLSLGFGAGLVGPTLLKFGEQTKSSLDRVVYILFTRALGYLCGTLGGGILIDRFPLFGKTFLTFSIFIMCITTLIIPFIYYLIPMIIVHLGWSVAAGVIDNLVHILAIHHYEQMNVNPYLQGLHGAFGIGAFFAPLIIAPFLQKSSPVDQWHYAYWLISFLHIPNVIWILVYAIRDEFCKKTNQEIVCENKEFISENTQNETNNIKSDDKDQSSKNYASLALITLFILLYVGGESAFGAYLHTYASLQLHFEKDTAAYLNSVFWASFAFSRLCGVPLSLKFSPLQMLISNLIGCIGSIALLLILNKSSLVLWIGSILFGLSIGPVYASIITFTEKKISLTGRRMSLLSVGGSIGDATIPLLIGYIVDPKLLGPIGFIFILFIVVILASLLFGCTVIYIKYQSKQNKNTSG